MKTFSGIVLDLETGGLDPERCAITEIGAVAFTTENGAFVEVESFHIQVMPAPNLYVCSSAANIQNRTMADIFAPAPLFPEPGEMYGQSEGFALAHFDDFYLRNVVNLKAHDPLLPIWAQNAPFDNAFMVEARRRNPGCIKHRCADRGDYRCTKQLAMMLESFGRLKTVSFSLSCLADAVGVTHDEEQRHGALYDARLTLLVLSELAKRAGWIG